MQLNNHKEKPKRLDPTTDTLKSLYLKSGNQCAFPCCQKVMMIGDTRFGQVCHIEDALPGGRWNPTRSNEDNRREDNLMLFCYEHHKITDNVVNYPSEDLKEMKRIHEHRITKGITPTVVEISGDGDVTMYRANISGGAQFKTAGAGKKRIVNLNVEGGKNSHLTEEDFLPPLGDEV